MTNFVLVKLIKFVSSARVNLQFIIDWNHLWQENNNSTTSMIISNLSARRLQISWCINISRFARNSIRVFAVRYLAIFFLHATNNTYNTSSSFSKPCSYYCDWFLVMEIIELDCVLWLLIQYFVIIRRSHSIVAKYKLNHILGYQILSPGRVAIPLSWPFYKLFPWMKYRHSSSYQRYKNSYKRVKINNCWFWFLSKINGINFTTTVQ